MKNQFICLLVLFVVVAIAKGQSGDQGIILNPNDFVNKKISFQKRQGLKYKMHVFEGSPHRKLSIILGDSLFHFSKDSIFGYVDRHHDFYRIYNQTIFKILNPNETLLIYAREYLGGYKNTQTLIEYYFSRTPGAPIHKLNLHQLKLVFSDLQNFREQLDLAFDSDADLLEFDKGKQKYKINELNINAE